MNSTVRLAFLLALLVAGITSCRQGDDHFGYERKEAAEQFVQHLKNNNEQGVYQMTLHGDMPDNITDEELRRRDVQRAAEMINRYGLPPQRQWRFTVDTTNRTAPYSVTIPLLQKSNTEAAYIYIAFPPTGESDKIARYMITAPDASPVEKNRPV